MSNNKNNKNKPPQISAMGKLIAQRQKAIADEEARIKAQRDEEERKIKEEEERLAEIKRKEEEFIAQKKKLKQDKIMAQKLAGTYKTKSEKEKDKKNKKRYEALKSFGIINSDGNVVGININSSNINSSDNNSSDNNSSDNNFTGIKLRSPIICIMGHVDTGKTKLLDYLRNTNVQNGEVGGITQQIGATLLSNELLLSKINKFSDLLINNLILIDTPGHEAFNNLRLRGSNLCDLAIVVVDLVHGLEPQTIQSIKMLISSNTPFIFAFNKIDRLYGWVSCNNNNIKDLIFGQNENTISEFDTRCKFAITQIMELGINCKLWNWREDEDEEDEEFLNICPISALTGDGVSDLLSCVINYCQTKLFDKLILSSELECYVMEVNNTDNYGYTIDVILINGELNIGDVINISNKTTQIKNLLTPYPNKESRVSTQFLHHKKINYTCGIKIVANNLNDVLAGSKITIVNGNVYEDVCENISENISEDINKNPNINLDTKGIAICASSAGSLEALYLFLKQECSSSILISQANIGSVSKKDLLKLLLVNNANTANTVNTVNANLSVLLFDVNIDEEIEQYAKSNNINIFKDETIYRLYNQYKEFATKIYNEQKEIARTNAIFPCVLKIIESNIFNKKNPLIMGVEILEGNLYINTPIIILPSKTYIGKIIGIQINKKDIQIGKKGQTVCIKIDNNINPNITYGRQFTHTDILYSNISRQSLDVLKEYFRDDITKDDIILLVKLKKMIDF